MVEVAEHLVPTDGLTNTKISFTGFAVAGPNGHCRFEMTDEDGSPIGEIVVTVDGASAGSVDAMIVEAHRKVSDILRQWLYVTDKRRAAYERAK